MTAATVYDLASLTKPIATATIAMRLVEAGRLDLSSPVAKHDPHWLGAERRGRHRPGSAGTCVRSARLGAHLARPHRAGRGSGCCVGRALRLRAAIAERLQRHRVHRARDLARARRRRETRPAVRARARGLVLRRRLSVSRSSSRLRRPCEGAPRPPDSATPASGCSLPRSTTKTPGRWRVSQGMRGCSARPPRSARSRESSCRRCVAHPRPKRALAARGTIRRFLEPSSVPGSSRALGWDLMRPTSSCGTRMSASAFGHTGFTGTSLWIDPAADVYAVLLTNRVHPLAGPNEPMQAVRRAFHDALLER